MKLEKSEPEKAQFQSFITDDQLKMVVSLSGGERGGQIFQGVIPSLDCQDNLAEHFDSLQDLMEYISKQENRIINIDERFIRIVSVVNSKKSKQIVIAQIQLIPIHTRIQLRNIIDKCSPEKSLKLADIKPLMKDIAQILSELLNQTRVSSYQQWQNANIFKPTKQNKSGVKQSEENENKLNDSQIYNQMKQFQENISQQNEQFWNNFQSSTDIKITHLSEKIELQNPEKLQQSFLSSNELHQLVANQIKLKIQELTHLFATQNQITNLSQKLDKICKLFETNEDKVQFQDNAKAPSNSYKKMKRRSKKNQNEELFQQRKQDNDCETDKLIDCQIDPQCFYFQNVAIQNGKIIAKESADLFGLKPLNNSKKKCSFSVTFHIMKKFSGIGIIDREYRNEPELTKLNNPLVNQIKYWSDKDVRNGKLIKSDQGLGYSANEKVTVVVDFNVGSVEWRVNQSLIHKVQNNQLKNKSIKWVPCLYLNNEGDMVSLESDEQ